MQTEKTGVIYRIYHKESGLSYIGKTVNPESRIRDHLNGKGKSPRLTYAINKHGKDAFGFEILESEIPQEHLTEMEMLYIYFYNSKSPNGYNLTDGGDGVVNPSDEVRKHISERQIGRVPWNKGKTGIYSDETLKKMSKASKGRTYKKRRTFSPEARQNISKSKQGQNHPNYGKHLSPETRQKISEAQKGKKRKPHSPETRNRIAESNKTTKRSPEYRQRVREATTGEKNPFYGKRHSPESRKKMSKSHRRKRH